MFLASLKYYILGYKNWVVTHSRLSLKDGKPGESTPPPAVLRLKPIEATAETFGEFGQVIEASPDGEEFGPQDAQLDLSRGIPRSSFYASLFVLSSLFLSPRAYV